GRPPNIIERAQSAVSLLRRAVTRVGRPRLAGVSREEEASMEQRAAGLSLADLQGDLAAAHDLIAAWVATPFTSREDIASGKDRDARDAGDTEAEIVERLEYILGLRGRRGEFGEAFIPNHAQADRRRAERGQVPLGEAQAGLVHALGRFAQAQLGPDSEAIAPGRLADLFAAVLTAWRALIHYQLANGLAREALLDVRQN
ncbi:MAG TPA: hypothetical protein VMB21_01245, partial [Candidatus Limnocylindria bacterium]|nr:hypothetical protein [Candidatus Limnocylindria bacterium]